MVDRCQWAVALVVLAAAAGCSAKPKEHAPALGDCLPDAGCITSLPVPIGGTSGSGGTGGSDGGESGAGGDSGAGGGFISTCGQVGFVDDVCGACMDRSCCSYIGSCSAIPDCTALITCLTRCADNDTTCSISCSNDHQEGASSFNTLMTCMQTLCNGACQSSSYGDGGVGCGTLSFNRASCTTCVNQVCCGVARDCSNDTNCMIIETCAQLCLPGDAGDPDCRPRCQSLAPDGVVHFKAFDDCMVGNCGALCP
jgi:hypothetical protein